MSRRLTPRQKKRKLYCFALLLQSFQFFSILFHSFPFLSIDFLRGASMQSLPPHRVWPTNRMPHIRSLSPVCPSIPQRPQYHSETLHLTPVSCPFRTSPSSFFFLSFSVGRPQLALESTTISLHALIPTTRRIIPCILYTCKYSFQRNRVIPKEISCKTKSKSESPTICLLNEIQNFPHQIPPTNFLHITLFSHRFTHTHTHTYAHVHTYIPLSLRSLPIGCLLRLRRNALQPPLVVLSIIQPVSNHLAPPPHSHGSTNVRRGHVRWCWQRPF